MYRLCQYPEKVLHIQDCEACEMENYVPFCTLELDEKEDGGKPIEHDALDREKSWS